MGTLDKIEDAAKDLLLKVVGEGVTKAAGALSDLVFGNSADDDLKEKLARAALKGAADALAEEALKRKAQAHLGERFESTMNDVASIDLKALFTPTGDVTDLDVPTKIAATLTTISWDLLKGSDAQVEVLEAPSESGIVGWALGTPIVLGDVDRNVPADVQAVIDERWQSTRAHSER